MNSPLLRIGIACYPTYGGSGALATELGIALADRGHEIHFLSYESPFRLKEFHSNIIYHQVGVQDYPLFKYPPYALALATTMAEVCELHNLDVLHVHYAIPHLVSANLAKQMLIDQDVKVISTLHGTDITVVGNDPSYRRVVQFSLEEADGVTAVSQYLKNETYRSVGTTCEIRVIPNFVDLDRFSASVCPEAAKLCCDDEVILIHVSNFRPVKRVNDLVHVMVELKNNGVSARLIMVGDGPDKPAAELLARQLKVAEQINFLGLQDSVEQIIPCADIFLLPSEFESFGLSALEAMACGVPVIATNSGGLPEVIQDGVSGKLVPVGDIRGFALAIQELVTDPNVLKQMGKNARHDAVNRFSIQDVVPAYLDYYYELLSDEDGVCHDQDVEAT